MDDPVTWKLIQILRESSHILVPLEELYDRLMEEGWIAWMTLDQLGDLIATDERFEVYEGLAESDLLDPLIQFALQERGLLAGPLVTLRDRTTSDEQIFADMLSHLKEMNAALETAWQLRPPGNPEVEAELLNLLMMGDILEREIRRALEGGNLIADLDVDVDDEPDTKLGKA